MSHTLVTGDCRTVLAGMQAESIDACVTDPPYELGFMGKSWDKKGIAFEVETWAAIYRVLKPGARLLAFGGSRTHHRIWCAIEDAGFVLEDTIMWLYGSGFPKHRSKLKPAYEPICVARKGPVSDLNIDGARIGLGGERAPTGSGDRRNGSKYAQDEWTRTKMANGGNVTPAGGRWPANVVLDEEAGKQLDGDAGGASRFYYVAKADKAEREFGLEGRPAQRSEVFDARPSGDFNARMNRERRPVQRANHHPTVKPLGLMRWLVRLVTPANGVVLDPFTGSGTTGVAAITEGFGFVGIELDPDYTSIAKRRIGNAPLSLGLGA